MNRLSVSALALVATSLTLPAYAAEPARSKPVAEKAVAERAERAERPARGDKARAIESDATGDEGATKEEPVGDSDSLLPSDHKESAPREAERPLVLRKSPADKPLELAAEKPSDSIWLKLGACGLILGGALFAMKKRGLLKAAPREHTMTIVGRTAIGVRSELLLVDVDGQKLLLGVTPNSISRLAVMPVHGDAPSLMEETLDPVPRVEQEPGFDSALDSAREQLEDFAARLKSRAPESPSARAAKARPSRHEAATPSPRNSRPSADDAEHDQEMARRARARRSHVERELTELRASRPAQASRPDLGEQAQSLMRLRQARGR